MEKVLTTWETIGTPRGGKKEQRSLTPERLCEIADILPHVLVASVCGEIWRLKSAESAMVAAIAHPKVLSKMAKNATDNLHPDQHKAQELFLRTTGSLPDRKGVTVIGDHARVVSTGSPGLQPPSQTGTFISMDQAVIENNRMLEQAAERSLPFIVDRQPEAKS